MNLLACNPDTGEFYLLGIFMREDGRYGLTSVYLYPNGSFRTKGTEFWSDTKEQAIDKCRKLLRVKRKMKNYHTCGLSRLPVLGYRYLKPDLDKYVSPEEMLRMVDEAAREHYVEFECVVGIEDRFDEGVEYLGLRDPIDEEFYNVYDRNGETFQCHESRFSRTEPTERAVELGVTKEASSV